MKWTDEKIDLLRSRYPNEDNAVLAQELGCSRKALAFRASKLGIKKTETANEARYAKLNFAKFHGARRKIATGTVIVHGNTLTHILGGS